MPHLKAFALFLCFIYFLALVMGYPEARFPSPTIIKITEPEPQEAQAQVLGFYWKTGILKKIYLQAQALDLFEEELLEGDTKPEEIFRSLQRSLVQNIFFLCLSIFWLCLLGLYLLNFRAKDLFLKKLSNFLLLSSTLFLSADIFLSYHRGILKSISESSFTSVRTSAEIIILFFSMTALLYQFVLSKIKARQAAKSSNAEAVEGETQSLHSFSIKWRSLSPFVFHFLLICAAALLLANSLLFPLYALQLSFPNFFALFLFLLVLALIAYYVYAYWSMFFVDKAKNSLSIALTFLAYRLLRNTLFLLSIFFIVGLLVGSIIFITTYNVDILHSIGGY